MLRAWSARRMACFRLNPVLLWQPSIVTMRLVSKCRRTRSCVIPRSMNLRSPRRRRRRRGRIERECVRERGREGLTERLTLLLLNRFSHPHSHSLEQYTPATSYECNTQRKPLPTRRSLSGSRSSTRYLLLYLSSSYHSSRLP